MFAMAVFKPSPNRHKLVDTTFIKDIAFRRPRDYLRFHPPQLSKHRRMLTEWRESCLKNAHVAVKRRGGKGREGEWRGDAWAEVEDWNAVVPFLPFSLQTKNGICRLLWCYAV